MLRFLQIGRLTERIRSAAAGDDSATECHLPGFRPFSAALLQELAAIGAINACISSGVTNVDKWEF
jgi:hypothetical protein